MFLTNLGGSVAEKLIQSRLDYRILRPWYDRQGRSCVTLLNNQTGKLQNYFINAPSLLPYDAWKIWDDQVLTVSLPELRIWGDLGAMGLRRPVPNAFQKMVLQFQTITDSGVATMSMSPLRQSERDRPSMDIGGLPLPLIHSDFSFDLRELEEARGAGFNLDDTQINNATFKCSEQVEKLTLGVASTYTYAGYTIYGITNHPNRITKVLTNPTAGGWTPETTYTEVLDMLQSLRNIHFNGPYGIYFSSAWAKYLDSDFATVYEGPTLREKLRRIEVDNNTVRFVRTVNYLTGFQIVLVTLDSRYIRQIDGMPFRTVQWESHGGFQINFKVIGIQLPQIRANSDGYNGIVHGTAP